MSIFNIHSAIIKKLVGQVVPGGPEKDEKWKEKAIKSLVKKLKKTNQLTMLDRAIMNKDCSTQCITIPRSLDGRLQVGPKKGWPHVFYCQLFRWPDLTSQHELRPTPVCEYSFHMKRNEVCVNPYHYTRVENPSVMVPCGSRPAAGDASTSRLNNDFRSLRIPAAPPLKVLGGDRIETGQQRVSVSSDATPPAHPSSQNVFFNAVSAAATSSSPWSPAGDSGSTPSASTVVGDMAGGGSNGQVSTPFSPFQTDALVPPSHATPEAHSVFSEDAMDMQFDNFGMEMTLSGHTLNSEQEDTSSMDLMDSQSNQGTYESPHHQIKLEMDSVGVSGSSASSTISSNFASGHHQVAQHFNSGASNSVGDSMSSADSVTGMSNANHNNNNENTSAVSPHAGLLTPVDYHVEENWCRVLYYEYNQRVGDSFYCSSPHLTVDGYTNPSRSDRFCLGMLSNMRRENSCEVARRQIGRGLTLFYLGGEVLVECVGENAIFVQSPNCNHMNNWHPATVVKVPPGSNLTIFNNTAFAELLKNSVQHGYDAVYELCKMCSFRISFVKGWGEAYQRQSITTTPCWIEIQLTGPLQWLDRVLQKIGSSTRQCSSYS